MTSRSDDIVGRIVMQFDREVRALTMDEYVDCLEAIACEMDSRLVAMGATLGRCDVAADCHDDACREQVESEGGK